MFLGPQLADCLISVQMLRDSRNSGIPVVSLVGNAVETTSVVERYVEYNFDRHLFRGTVN